eukprot:4007283-Pyramimonas_sp.AAC.3
MTPECRSIHPNEKARLYLTKGFVRRGNNWVWAFTGRVETEAQIFCAIGMHTCASRSECTALHPIRPPANGETTS